MLQHIARVAGVPFEAEFSTKDFTQILAFKLILVSAPLYSIISKCLKIKEPKHSCAFISPELKKY